MKKITVEDQKDTEYVEQYDINSKYDRRPKEELPDLDDLSFSQMAKMYRSYWGKKSDQEEDCFDEFEHEDLQPASSQVNYETPAVPLQAKTIIILLQCCSRLQAKTMINHLQCHSRL